LVPLGQRLHIDGADFGVTLLLQGADEVSTDETTSAGDDHKVILGHDGAFQA
jgi:hypothetical protein